MCDSGARFRTPKVSGRFRSVGEGFRTVKDSGESFIVARVS